MATRTFNVVRRFQEIRNRRTKGSRPLIQHRRGFALLPCAVTSFLRTSSATFLSKNDGKGGITIVADLPRLLTTREAASVLRLTKQHLANLRSAGTGPIYAKIGAKVFYPEESLKSYIADRTVDPSRRGVR